MAISRMEHFLSADLTLILSYLILEMAGAFLTLTIALKVTRHSDDLTLSRIMGMPILFQSRGLRPPMPLVAMTLPSTD